MFTPIRRQGRTVTGFALLVIAGCGGGTDAGTASGTITGDGSSTVYPIAMAASEEFTRANGAGVRVTVANSGTGGGFKRFCAGETDLSNASRPIKDEEKAICDRNNVEFIDFTVAYDGLSVVVNPKNTFAECLTVAELRKIWEPESQVKKWSQVRAGFPDNDLKLYGPGTASGTFDYFTEVINGKVDASRSDYSASEDDNVLVQGVQGDPNALGYFGFAYYQENQDKLRVLGVDNGSGCVVPSPETIKSGQYAPLSRPLMIYVNRKALDRPEVQAYLTFLNENAAQLVPKVGYVPLEAAQYQENLGKIPASAQ